MQPLLKIIQNTTQIACKIGLHRGNQGKGKSMSITKV